jgi:hypothetical protein
MTQEEKAKKIEEIRKANEKAHRIDAVYKALREFVQVQIRELSFREDGTQRTGEEFSREVKITYQMIFYYLKAGIEEMITPSLFGFVDKGLQKTIEELGKDIYLDEIIRRAVPFRHDIPKALYDLPRTPLTPEVLATLNSDPEEIEKRLFIKAPAEIDIEELLTREITLPPTDPDRYKVDLNFLRYPSFSLRRGKKTGNRVRYEGTRSINGKEYRVVTRIGTTDGVLTPFDYDVLFRGICSYIRHDEITGRWYASFKTNDILERIGKPVNDKGGGFYKMIYNALRKLPTFNIEHNTYISGPEGEPEHLTANMFDRVYNPEIGDNTKEHRFIFTASLGQTLSNTYTRTFDRREIKNLPDPISKRVYEVLSDLLAYRKSQVIGIDTLAERIPIEDSNKARRRSKVIKALDAQERFCYTLEGDTLTIKKDAPGRTRTDPEVKVEEDTPAEALKDLTIGLGSQAQAEPDTRTASRRDWDKERERVLNYLRGWNIPEDDLPEISLDPNRPGNNKAEKWKDKLTGFPGAFKTITDAIKHLEENLPEEG